MSKRSCFKIPFGNQRVNGSQTLLKSGRQHFYPISALFYDKLNRKLSLVVRSAIVRLLSLLTY